MKIKFYGATWCADCRAPKEFLDKNKIAYEYINIDDVEGAGDEVKKINNGLQAIPTIVFPNGIVLTEPSIAQLQQALEDNKDLI